jgi:hypothetical protein
MSDLKANAARWAEEANKEVAFWEGKAAEHDAAAEKSHELAKAARREARKSKSRAEQCEAWAKDSAETSEPSEGAS